MPDWVFVAGGATLATAALVTLAWGLVGDRARGRKRCPKCWYSMGEAVADATERYTCPECGSRIHGQRRLLKRRIRKRAVAVAVVFFVGSFLVAAHPRTQQRGWMWPIPTRLVIELLPIGGLDGVFGKELRRRIGFAQWPDRTHHITLTPEQQVFLVRRVTRGNLFASPIGARWKASYGAVITEYRWNLFSLHQDSKCRDGSPETAELRRAIEGMLDLPYELHVRSRPVWVRGREASVEAEVEHYWPAGVDGSVYARYRSSDGTFSGETGAKDGFDILIPDAPALELDISIDVIREPWTDIGVEHKTLATEQRRIQISTVASPEELITPVVSAELDAELLAGVEAAWAERGGLSLRPRLSPAAEGIAFGVEMELLDGDRVIERCWARWTGRGLAVRGNRVVIGPCTGDMHWREQQELLRSTWEDPRWSIRIRGSPHVALFELDAEQCWQGELVLPIKWERQPQR